MLQEKSDNLRVRFAMQSSRNSRRDVLIRTTDVHICPFLKEEPHHLEFFPEYRLV